MRKSLNEAIALSLTISFFMVAIQLSVADAETREAEGQRLYQEGKDLQRKGDHKGALDSFERALVIIKDVYGSDHPAVVATLTNIGGVWHSLGHYHKAIDYHQQALDLGMKLYGREHPNQAITLNNLALAWKRLGAYDKARDYLKDSLAICQSRLGDNHPYTKSAKASLSDVEAKLRTTSK